MQDRTRTFVQTRVAPLVNAIEGSVLRLGYTQPPIRAHLMALDILADAAIEAIRQLPYPGIESPDSVLESQFTPLLRKEVERAFERIRGDPAAWIRPGDPLDLTPRPDLSSDSALFIVLLALIQYPLAFDTDGLAEGDLRYIAQRLVDAGVLPLPGDEPPGKSVDEDYGELPASLTADPPTLSLHSGLIPILFAPTAPDEVLGLSEEAHLDADMYRFFVELLAPAYDLPVTAYFARLRDLEWLDGAIPRLPAREQEWILRVYIQGMVFETSDTLPLGFLKALAHLQQLWIKDHP